MPLTIVTGGANSGKTAVAYDFLSSARATGGAAALLLPTGPDVERARRELAPTAPTRLAVSQFDRYLDERWRVEGDGREIATPVQRRALVRAILARATAAGPPGLHRVLERAVAAGAPSRPASAVAHARVAASATDDGGGVEIGEEVVALSAIYRDELEALGLIERTAAHLWVSKAAGDLSGTALAAHRFSTLSSTQVTYLLAAAAAGADVLVTLAWVEGRAATAVNDALLERLADHGELLRLEEPAVRFGPAELASVEADLFEDVPSRPAEGAVTLVEAEGEEAEARAVAQEIERLLGDGLEGHEIAVVFRDPRARSGRVEEALEAAGIPYDLDVPISVGATALGAALEHLLAFAVSGGRSPLTAYLRTPYSGMSLDAADRLDARWRRGRVDDVRRLAADVHDARAAVGHTLRSVRSLAGAAWDEESASGWAVVLSGMLANAYGREAPLLGAARAADGDVQRTVVSVLQDLARVTGIEGASWLRDALSRATVQPKTVERPAHVQVMDAERVRSRRFRAVVLGGLDSGEFPRSRDAGDPDAVSRLLAEIGVEGPRRADLGSERLLFYQAVTRASERLVLVRRTSDSEGTPLRPSVFWEEFMDLYRTPLEPEATESLDETQIPDSRLPIRHVSRPGSPTVRDDGSALEARRRAGAARGPSRPDGTLPTVGAERDVFSASELERYLSCPYRWFVERVVRVESLDRELGPLETGLLSHDALRRFYEVWGGGEPRRVQPGDLEEALSVLDATWNETMRGVEPTDAVEREACARTRASVRGLLRQDAASFLGYTPSHLEWSFGIDDEPEDIGGFALRGRVDRVDVSESGALLMDYKRGDVHAWGKFEELGLVQLPLYAEVARRRLGRDVAGAFYRSLTRLENKGFFVRELVREPGPGAGGGVLDADGMERVVESAIERARGAVEGIRAGRIAPEPLDEGSCRWCPAATFCEEGGAR